MIAIDRSTAVAPPDLVQDGAHDLARLRRLRRACTLHSDDIKRSIYSSNEVRRGLWTMQHHKCCFCERPYEPKFSTVEHFRPKTRARTASGRRQWGYWWLAYTFDNLYFCCSNCNTPKSDWFPIAGGQRRLQEGEHPRRGPYREPSLIVDPGHEDPEKHVVFVKGPRTGLWRMTHLDRRGYWTIRAAQLDRDDLDVLRDKYIHDYLQHVVNLKGRNPTIARDFARRLCAGHMPYALLARCVFRREGLFP